MRNKFINIIPALAVAAAIYAWSVEEVGVLVGVEDVAANRRSSGTKRECLAFQILPVPLAIRLAVARVLEWRELVFKVLTTTLDL